VNTTEPSWSQKRGFFEDSILLGCHATSLGYKFPVFWENAFILNGPRIILGPLNSFKRERTCRHRKMKALCSLETSGTKYPVAECHTQENGVLVCTATKTSDSRGISVSEYCLLKDCSL